MRAQPLDVFAEFGALVPTLLLPDRNTTPHAIMLFSDWAVQSSFSVIHEMAWRLAVSQKQLEWETSSHPNRKLSIGIMKRAGYRSRFDVFSASFDPCVRSGHRQIRARVIDKHESVRSCRLPQS
jgi:hypothetical protein